MEATTADYTIDRLSPHTGAEVCGLDLREPMDAATRRRLNQAFVDHSVLVIRGQTLSAPQLLAAIQQFGDVLQQHNTKYALPECPLIHYISNQDKYPDGSRYIAGGGYHTDHSNAVAPPKATILCAVSLPDRGGDTQYVNMHEAYDGLSPAMQAKIAGRKATHVYQEPLQRAGNCRRPAGRTAQGARSSVAHPLGYALIPKAATGQIYLNPVRTEGIVGMDDDEGLPLLDALLAHATQEKYQYRHRWQTGDVVMWDNRCPLLHKANGDYDMGQLRYACTRSCSRATRR